MATDTQELMAELAELVKVVGKHGREIGLPVLAEASKFMFSNDWWMLNPLTVRQYQAIVGAKSSLTPESLTTTLVRFFRPERLEDLINRWTPPPFKSRHEVFAEVLWAHNNARYTLSTAVAVLQIEGVLRDFHRAEFSKVPFKFDPIRQALSSRFKQIERLPSGQPLEPDDVRALGNYYNLKVFERLYAQYDPGVGGEPDFLNRHAIAHGLSLRYGTEQNSVRAILMLDTVESLIDQLTP
jgi:hypothetical protein